MPEGAAPPAAAVWPVDKPAGPTSHDVVAAVRRRLPRRAKVGHSGTLDPFATGLLLIMVGRATRLSTYLTGLDKTYLADVRTGFTSASGDPEGPIVPAGRPADAAAVEAVLPRFLGAVRQRVPALSAVRVGGERLYERARRGEVVEDLPEREVAVHDLRLVEDLGGGEVRLEVRCGSGTYVRSLVADIGAALGAGAYCTALRRTAVGALRVEDAVAPEDVTADGGPDPLTALGHMPRRDLTADEAEEVLHGRPLPAGDEPEGDVALAAGGRLLAVARRSGDALRPAVVLGAAA